MFYSIIKCCFLVDQSIHRRLSVLWGYTHYIEAENITWHSDGQFGGCTQDGLSVIQVCLWLLWCIPVAGESWKSKEEIDDGTYLEWVSHEL